MTKWIWIGLAIAVIGVFVVRERNAVKTAYVNGLPLYRHLPGREFILQRDCYIFKFKDDSSSWPLIGAHTSVPALPAEVNPTQVGTDLADVRLLDIARAGSRLKIVSVRRDQSRTRTTISFELLFMDEAERKYPRVDAFWIMDHSSEERGEAPVIREDYAVPRVKL